MGELREIVEVGAIERLFVMLAVGGPVAGLLIGAAVGARQREAKRGLLTGLLIGLFGPLNWLLWHLYNAITDANGLDTVRNLLINLALFVAAGLVLGAAARFWLFPRLFPLRRSDPPNDGGELATVGATPVSPSPGRAPGNARTIDEAQQPPRDS